MKKIIKYVIADILRNKIVLFYLAFLLVMSLSVFNLEDSASKGLLSLLNIVLIIVPMTCIIFSTIYVYNSAEFIELLVSQPLQRKTIWLSLFIGLSSSLCLAFIVGAGIPILMYSATASGLMILAMGLFISIIFVAIAMLAVVLTRDKAKGIGLSILVWLYFSLLFDGIVLFILFQFQDYSLEKPMILMSSLNPIDLGRILVLLKMDVSALMGYTGAIFKDFFGTRGGTLYSVTVMSLWIILPAWLSTRKFIRKDL